LHPDNFVNAGEQGTRTVSEKKRELNDGYRALRDPLRHRTPLKLKANARKAKLRSAPELLEEVFE
jgi:DnaJ-domain-containing protein 1